MTDKEASCGPNELVAEHAEELAQKMADTNVIGEEQAHVYALVKVFGVSPKEAAEVLDKESKTVYNLLYQAEDRVEEAQALAWFLDEWILDGILSIQEELDQATISDPEVVEERKEVRRQRKKESFRRSLDILAGRDPFPLVDPEGDDAEELFSDWAEERMDDIFYVEDIDAEDIEKGTTVADLLAELDVEDLNDG